MLSAHNKLYIKLATPILGVAFLLISPNLVLASDTTVGEFLYDDREYIYPDKNMEEAVAKIWGTEKISQEDEFPK